jgi:hypothetical protein
MACAFQNWPFLNKHTPIFFLHSEGYNWLTFKLKDSADRFSYEVKSWTGWVSFLLKQCEKQILKIRGEAVKGIVHFLTAEPQETAQVLPQMKPEKLPPMCVVLQMTQFGSTFDLQIPHPRSPPQIRETSVTSNIKCEAWKLISLNISLENLYLSSECFKGTQTCPNLNTELTWSRLVSISPRKWSVGFWRWGHGKPAFANCCNHNGHDQFHPHYGTHWEIWASSNLFVAEVIIRRSWRFCCYMLCNYTTHDHVPGGVKCTSRAPFDDPK